MSETIKYILIVFTAFFLWICKSLYASHSVQMLSHDYSGEAELRSDAMLIQKPQYEGYYIHSSSSLSKVCNALGFDEVVAASVSYSKLRRTKRARMYIFYENQNAKRSKIKRRKYIDSIECFNFHHSIRDRVLAKEELENFEKGTTDIALLRNFVDNGGDPHISNTRGSTLLHAFVELGDHVYVEKILGIEAYPIDQRDQKGWTPLQRAAKNAYLDIVITLIKNGASSTLRGYQDRTPIEQALKDKNWDIVDFLLESDALSDDDRRFNAQVLLVNELSKRRIRHINMTLFRKLVDHGANLPITGRNGRTILAVLAYKNDLDYIKKVLEMGPNIDLDKKGYNDFTALQIAASYGHLDIVKYLVRQGASLNKRGNQGKTPLETAKMRRQRDVVNYLKKH